MLSRKERKGTLRKDGRKSEEIGERKEGKKIR
jgi:hypothetical protein